MRTIFVRYMSAVAVAAFLLTPGLTFAQANPCAAKNPCAAQNPCAAKETKPKKAAAVKDKKQEVKNPCAANPCAANPCATKKN